MRQSQETHVAWLRTSPFGLFGGGERVFFEAVACFRKQRVMTTLLLSEHPGHEASALLASHQVTYRVLQGLSVHNREKFYARARSFREEISELSPDFVIASEMREARQMWTRYLGGLLPHPPLITFIHVSPFQFADEHIKYALVFRRNFNSIRDSDPVYRELIPRQRGGRLTARQRLAIDWHAFLLRAGVRMSRLILVLSEKNRREVELLYGTKRIEVLSPGGFTEEDMRMPRSFPARTFPVFLSVCRLIKKKRVDFIIRSFRAFLDAEPGSAAELVIAGTGPEGEPLRQLAADLDLENKVRFTGFVPDDRLRSLYQECDVFLNADNADYDLTAMAALLDGRSVVASTQYAIPNTLTALRRFFFIADPNPESFAETMRSALKEPPAPLGDDDEGELKSLTWEAYFSDVLRVSRAAI